MRTSKLYLLILLIIYSCAPAETEQLTNYPNSHLLIDAPALMDLLQTSQVFLIDARDEPGDSLLPGATHFAAVRELVDPGHQVASYLIGPDEFQEKMRDLGLFNGMRVIIYDEGNHLAAARLFYALDYYGFSNTSLLHGGVQAWKENNLPFSSSTIEYPYSNFTVSVREALMCDFEYITEAANSPDKIIFDARSVEEYTGEVVRSERGGHIPNAVNLEWRNVLQQDGVPYFLPVNEIQKLFAERGITPDKEVIPHCQTNVRGSHAYFTLRLMGYDSVRPYEGSWFEYGNRSDAVIQ